MSTDLRPSWPERAGALPAVPSSGDIRWVAPPTWNRPPWGLRFAPSWRRPDRSPSSSPTTTGRSARRWRSRSTRSRTSASSRSSTDGEAVPRRLERATRRRAHGPADARRRRDRGDAPDPHEGVHRHHRDHPVGPGRRRRRSPGRSRREPAGSCAKTEAVGGLADAIRRAYRGEPLHTAPSEVNRVLPRRARALRAGRRPRSAIERLTPRELEILQRDGRRRPREDRG